MIKDNMIDEIQELKLAGYTVKEAYETLKARHTKVPTLKTVRKYYNMDCAPKDNHARVKKQAAFDVEPLRSTIIEVVERNPDCCMSSVYDVLYERFVESGEMEALPGNEQTLRNFIRRLRQEGVLGGRREHRRRYDVLDLPAPGQMAQIDFGQQDCGGGLRVHFMCVLLWHSRLLGVYAQDHRFNSEESCRALWRFSSRCGGRVATYVIDQDSVFVSREIYGEVFETSTFKAFLKEQDIGLWVCSKADPESKGAVENCVKFVKTSFFSARQFESIDDVVRTLPAWLDRKNRRIHQGTYQVPLEVFETVERRSLRPLVPSLWEAAPTDLVAAPVGSQPYVLHRAVKYSVPWEMCYTTAYKRVLGSTLHIYDDKRRYVCSHELCAVKGAFMRLDEHRRQPQSEWLDCAERMRAKWNCTEFQHFINGFKRENPERHLGRQLAAVERYLDERCPSRSLVAEVMEVCCRDYRYRFTQFKAVFDELEARQGDARGTAGTTPASEVDTRALASYERAFRERAAL